MAAPRQAMVDDDDWGIICQFSSEWRINIDSAGLFRQYCTRAGSLLSHLKSGRPTLFLRREAEEVACVW